MNQKLLEYFEEKVLPVLEEIDKKERVRIFIDDLRVCPEGWKLFRNGESFLVWLIENPDVIIECISFDHDLGEDFHSGYEIVQDMVELDHIKTDNIQSIMFHTDNLIGLKNMYCYLKNAQKHGALNPNIVISGQKRDCINGRFSISLYGVVM